MAHWSKSSKMVQYYRRARIARFMVVSVPGSWISLMGCDQSCRSGAHYCVGEISSATLVNVTDLGF